MAYTLADIRNRVLNDRLDDASYDTTIIDRFINDTQREIFNTYELPFQEKVFAGALPQGANIFTLPDDYQMTQSMVLTTPTGYRNDLSHQYINFRDFNAYYPTPAQYVAGPPSVWTLYGRQLYFTRPTDQAYTISLFYLKTPKLLAADADVPEIPEEFGEVLVLGAYYRALERNEDFDQAAFIRDSDYADMVDLMVSRLSKRQSASPSTIRQTTRSSRGRVKRSRA